MPHSIAVTNVQNCLTLDEGQMRASVAEVLTQAGIFDAEISLAFVDNSRIHELNRQFLQHDFPTDVISFVLERDNDHLEGEIVVSAEMARDTAPVWHWSPADELMLYVVHGTLHLVGYDDTTDEAALEMRRAELAVLERLGITIPLHGERLRAEHIS